MKCLEDLAEAQAKEMKALAEKLAEVGQNEAYDREVSALEEVVTF